MFLIPHGASAEAREPNSAFPLAWDRRDSAGFGGLFQSETAATQAAAALAVPAERYGVHGSNYWWFCFPGAPRTEAIILSFLLPVQTALAKYKTDSTINMDSVRDSGENLLAENIILQ